MTSRIQSRSQQTGASREPDLLRSALVQRPYLEPFSLKIGRCAPTEAARSNRKAVRTTPPSENLFKFIWCLLHVRQVCVLREPDLPACLHQQTPRHPAR